MALRRLAILIGGKDLAGKDNVKGLEKDLYDFSQYLVSNQGGAWDEDAEIKFLYHPTRRVVRAALSDAERTADYCVIVYGGHGCHYKKPLNETCVCLSDNEEVMVSELNPRTRRHLVILDTCRKLTAITEQRSKALGTMSFSASADSLDPYRRSCRELFEKTLKECEEGRCVAYSCNVAQAAGDDDSGGYFTQAMINAGTAFHNGKSPKYYANEVQDLSTSFRLAHARVQQVNFPQDPVLEQGRRISSFPFSVR